MSAAYLLSSIVYSVSTHLHPDQMNLHAPVWIGGTGLLLLIALRRGWLEGVSLRSAIAVALAAKLILITASPAMENDYFRYFWDGRVAAHGINPYLMAPADERLIDLEISWWTEIGYKEIPTIYPPTCQLFFLLAYLLCPGSLLGMKLLFLVADFALILLLRARVRSGRLSRPLAIAAILHPLYLHEVFVTAHIDLIAVLFLALAFFTRELRWSAACGASLAALALTKWFGLALAPLFFLAGDTRRERFRLAAGFFAAGGLISAPYIEAGPRIFEGLSIFARFWEFNGPLYYLVKSGFALSGQIAPGADARWVCAFAAFAVLMSTAVMVGVRRWRLPEATHVAIAGLLFTSPVAQPWYFLWLIPAWTASPSTLVYGLTIFAPMSYLFYVFGETFIGWSMLLSWGFPILLKASFPTALAAEEARSN